MVANLTKHQKCAYDLLFKGSYFPPGSPQEAVTSSSSRNHFLQQKQTPFTVPNQRS